jgi:hypothetical protein
MRTSSPAEEKREDRREKREEWQGEGLGGGRICIFKI